MPFPLDIPHEASRGRLLDKLNPYGRRFPKGFEIEYQTDFKLVGKPWLLAKFTPCGNFGIRSQTLPSERGRKPQNRQKPQNIAFELDSWKSPERPNLKGCILRNSENQLLDGSGALHATLKKKREKGAKNSTFYHQTLGCWHPPEILKLATDRPIECPQTDQKIFEFGQQLLSQL
jgi:hypothetical protein